MPEHRSDGAVSDSSANEVPVRRNVPVQSVGSSSKRGGATFDLRLDARALSARLSERLEAEAVPDEDEMFSTFLLAGGLYQVFEDYFHREAFVMQRAARLESSAPSPIGSLARVAATVAVGASKARMFTPSARAAARSRKALSQLVEQLARAVVDRRDTRALEDGRRSWALLRPSVDCYPERLLRTVLRLPDPFYRFDQSLADCRVLVDRFAERWPDRQRPILVLGIRTSGSYLAPLYRALLLNSGYRQVEMLTVRPRQRWRRREVAGVRAVNACDGLILITDDPPASGSAVARVAREVEQQGVPRAAVVIVVPLFGPASSLPEPIRPFASVVLPWREWSIHAQLAPESIKQALSRMLVGRKIMTSRGSEFRVAVVRGVESIDGAASGEAASGRRHASSRYRALLVGEAGETVEQQIIVTGLGPAYFCDRARGLASVLGRFLEAPLGIERGLLYEREVGPESRVQLPISRALEEWFVSYVVQRRDTLEVEADPSLRTSDDQMVWRMAADALGKALGGPFRALAFPVTHVASRRLLTVSRPSVIDGNLALSAWAIAPERPDRALKTDWLGRLACYDAAFDLATVAASADVEELVLGNDDDYEPALGARLLKTYSRRTGEEIDSERWLLYQLVENHQRLSYLGRELVPNVELDAATRQADENRRATMRRWLATQRALAKEYQRYISGVFFSDLDLSSDGPLCALDVDWVLETRWLEFPAIAPAGAVALRALLRHGYRPLLVTARSLGEVRDRCRMYRLAGGVAEFGSVLYDHQSERVLPQLQASDGADLARLRDELEKLPGVYLDHAYEYSVRAVRVTANGSVRGLEEDTIRAALEAADLESRIRVFRGGGQTDFIAASVHKGAGLRALATALGADPGDEHPIAFAMGDDWPDSPMFDLARAKFAPANISDRLRAELRRWPNLVVTRDPYGSGVRQAVAAFLGHDLYSCEVCSPPALSGTQKMLVTALGGLDGPRRRQVRQVAALAALLARSSFGGYR
jgi:hydroxymethylpyrimidine pyrophosphatase-like HAD family hydrolase